MKPKVIEIICAHSQALLLVLLTLMLLVSDAEALELKHNADISSIKVKKPMKERQMEVAPFRLLSSSQERISVKFQLPDFTVQKDAAGGEFSKISCTGSVTMTEPGYPALPSFVTRVAIPPDAGVRVNVTPGREATLGQLQLVPTPMVKGKDESGIPVYEFTYSDGFLQGGPFPEAYYSTSGPSYLRRLRVLTIILHPFRINPQGMDVSYFSEASIEIGLRQPSPAGSSPVKERDPFDLVYESLVLNPQDSKKWLRPREPNGAHLSVFQTGEDWVKVVVKEEGIYRVTYHDLFELGVEPGMIDPTSLQMYYLGGTELPEDVSEQRPQMREIAVRIEGGADGTFDPGDMIIFYGQSLSRWTSPDTYHSHRYTDDNAYWLTWGNPQAVPLRMGTVDVSPSGLPDYTNTTRTRFHFEQNTQYVTDEEKGYQSVPDDWIWEEISGTPGVVEEANFDFTMNNLAYAGTDSIRIELYGVPEFTGHKVWLSINGRMFHEIRFSGRFAHQTEWLPLEAGDLREGTNTLTVTLPKDESSVEEDAIYFGWFEISALQLLAGVGDGYIFEGSTDEGEIGYTLDVTSLSNPLLFNITDPFVPVELVGAALETNSLRFEDSGSTPPVRYALLDRSLLKLPSSLKLISGLKLKEAGKGADYVIITHSDLLSQAQRLADFRREENGFRVEVVTTDEIYQEFSGGLMDVTAIRDFLLWAYENWDPSPGWVVLFGDGHIDYKGYTTFGQNKPNMVPPHVERDLAFDDWFVQLNAGYEPDMFYGRMTVQDIEQAKIAVDKIMDYERNPEYGPWRSRVIIASDDCFRKKNCETLPHTAQSEDVDRRIPQEFQRVKVYLVDFPFDPPQTGDLKPQGTDYLIEQWNKGAIFLNYVGHGSPNQWAHEKLFYAPSHMSLLKGESRLPLVVTASCSIGHFDHFLYDGMVEDFMVQPGGGAIASFAATRVTYSDPNQDINNALVDTLFKDPYEPQYLGVAAVKAKSIITGGNSRRYTLFGDPATRLATPYQAVNSLESPDSLAPFEKTSYSGEVVSDGVRDASFDGYAQVDVYAPPRRREADECTCITTSYWDTGSLLFTGSVPVNSGSLTADFIVPGNIPSSLPADTQYTKNSRIYVYAWSDEGDAYGVVDSIPITQTSQGTNDTIPPELTIFSMGNELRGGEEIPEGSELSVALSDPNGINLTGAPGFQLLVEVDEGSAFRGDLTGAFKYNVGSYTTGSMEFQIPDLTVGPHFFSFRATDNALNTVRKGVSLNVMEEGLLNVTNALLYPNPFNSTCNITFDLTSSAIVTVKIFTTGGRLIKSLKYSGRAGFNSIQWDGTDHRGDKIANGAYLIKVIARSQSSNGPDSRDEAMLKALLLK